MAALEAQHTLQILPPHLLKMNFLPSEANSTYLSDDGMDHSYPSSIGQQPQSIMFFPQLQPIYQCDPAASAEDGALFSMPQDCGAIIQSPYLSYPQWSSQPSSLPMSTSPVPTYSYPHYTARTAVSPLWSGAAQFSQSGSTLRTSRPHSASSSIDMSLLSNVPLERSSPTLSRPPVPSLDLRVYGAQNNNGTWTCAYPGCTSRAVFTRGCDLRKHHKRHTKSLFCRHNDCPQSTGGGFSSKKDLARHEAKHNPGVLCDWDNCGRIFSRVDNMRDHVKRIHLKAPRKASSHSV